MSTRTQREGDAVTVNLNYLTPERAKQLRSEHFPQAHYAPVLVKATYVRHELQGWKHDDFRDLVRYENGEEAWVHPEALSEPLDTYQPDMSLVRVVQGKPPKSRAMPANTAVASATESNGRDRKFVSKVSKRQSEAAKTLFNDPPPDPAT